MKGSLYSEFRPVLRRPRREWIIPAIQLDRRSAKEPEPAQVEPEPTQVPNLALWEGTTPQGREILRKILFFIETRIERGEDTPQVIGQVETRLNGFSEIFPELLSIFSRLGGRRDADTAGIGVHDLATLMVLRVRLERARCVVAGSGRPAFPNKTSI
jgi:hypothetical protein